MPSIGRFDRETQFSDALGQQVDHAGSAKSNLEAAGEELSSMLPTLTGDALKTLFGRSPMWGGLEGGLARVVAGASLPFMVIGDVVKAPIMAALAAKDGVDAAVHGLIAGFNTPNPV